MTERFQSRQDLKQPPEHPHARDTKSHLPLTPWKVITHQDTRVVVSIARNLRVPVQHPQESAISPSLDAPIHPPQEPLAEVVRETPLPASFTPREDKKQEVIIKPVLPGYTPLQEVKRQDDQILLTVNENDVITLPYTNNSGDLEHFLQGYKTALDLSQDGTVSDRDFIQAYQALYPEQTMSKSRTVSIRRIANILLERQGYTINNSFPPDPKIEGKRYLAKIDALPAKNTSLVPSQPDKTDNATGQESKVPGTHRQETEQYYPVAVAEIEEISMDKLRATLSDGTIITTTSEYARQLLHAFHLVAQAHPEEAAFNPDQLKELMYDGTFKDASAYEIFLMVKQANNDLRKERLGIRYTRGKTNETLSYNSNTYHLRKYTQDLFMPEDKYYPKKDQGQVVPEMAVPVDPTPTTEAVSLQHPETPNPIALTERHVYEAALLLHRLNGQKLKSSSTPFTLSSEASSVSYLMLNDLRFKDVAQTVLPESRKKMQREILSLFETYLKNPEHTGLVNIKEDSSLEKALLTLASTFLSTENAEQAFADIRFRFGIEKKQLPQQGEILSSTQEKVTFTQSQLAEHIYTRVARELGTHANSLSIERVMEEVARSLQDSLPAEQRATAVIPTFTKEDILQIFSSELQKREKEGVENSRRARLGEEVVWSSPANEQAWKYLGHFRMKKGVSGKEGFKTAVTKGFENKKG